MTRIHGLRTRYQMWLQPGSGFRVQGLGLRKVGTYTTVGNQNLVVTFHKRLPGSFGLTGPGRGAGYVSERVAEGSG